MPATKSNAPLCAIDVYYRGTGALSAAVTFDEWTDASPGQEITIEISDDGRGVDRARVREKATALGLPHANERDLAEALFCDGLSTAESLTQFAGRGVGMAAVRDAAHLLGGTVRVRSTRGSGTAGDRPAL